MEWGAVRRLSGWGGCGPERRCEGSCIVCHCSWALSGRRSSCLCSSARSQRASRRGWRPRSWRPELHATARVASGRARAQTVRWNKSSLKDSVVDSAHSHALLFFSFCAPLARPLCPTPHTPKKPAVHITALCHIFFHDFSVTNFAFMFCSTK